LAAGLRRDPLESLSVPSDSLAAMRGPTTNGKRRGGKGGEGGEGSGGRGIKGRGGREGKRKEGRKGRRGEGKVGKEKGKKGLPRFEKHSDYGPALKG